jgi:2-polyprenyl-3-methyl-5-hydroxy-6-metoxy-1,4-benzoquinol methylase
LLGFSLNFLRNLGGVLGWLDFWNQDNSIYVNSRHLEAHYRTLLSRVKPLLPPPGFTLLDYGCGDALMAPDIADQGGTVLLYDAAPFRREVLSRRHAGSDRIRVLDDQMLDRVATGGCDVILMVSVLQYIPRADLPALLRRLAPLLSPGGRLVLGDVIAPDGSLVKDVTAMLRFAAANRFLFAALAGLVRTAFSNYGHLRRQVGLTTYGKDELVALMHQSGWQARILADNLGFDDNRWSMEARPA